MCYYGIRCLKLPGYNYRSTFQEAMDTWADGTCIQFQLATSSRQDQIEFVQSEHLGYVPYPFHLQTKLDF